MEWWSQIAWHLVPAYVLLGIVAGFLAGLLGIGGGGMMVPVLVWLFAEQGYPHEHIVHMGVATAMATVIFTSLSSVRAHARRGSVRWDIARAMAPGMLVGGFLGALVADRFSTFGLGLFFVVFVYIMATNMVVDRKPAPGRSTPGNAGLFVVGTMIGVLSALIAIGGAMMTVPFLIWCAVPVIQAVGTSSAIGFPVALASTVGYMWVGANASTPATAWGYVDLPAMASIATASVLLAPLGARFAHRLPTRTLRRAFAVFLFLLATRMLFQIWE
ncbi:MAG TPA: sulfite exporter TauE/SafE family protein [Burkholderiales bacterium]|nr:sulfite exporter TauE/SafE family protein [Burkholderiales bacterium]